MICVELWVLSNVCSNPHTVLQIHTSQTFTYRFCYFSFTDAIIFIFKKLPVCTNAEKILVTVFIYTYKLLNTDYRLCTNCLIGTGPFTCACGVLKLLSRLQLHTDLHTICVLCLGAGENQGHMGFSVN